MKEYTDYLHRYCWGTDAGFYRLTPERVLFPENEAQMSQVIRDAYSSNTPLTFRAAGTSLSGQAISDSLLVVAGKNWEKYSLGENAETITLEPGIVGGRVNRILAPHKRKFGPDPASIGSAMVGGIVANNASGMSCGVHSNSDKLLVSARIILSDGTILDTGDEKSRAAFRSSHPGFIRAIETLRDEVNADEELVELIKYKYSIKNVTGLNILPLINFSDPFDIIAHSMVGSEGTLAFLSQVTMKTLPLPVVKADAMIYFRDIKTAARAVLAMKNCSVVAAELLDPRSLASVGDKTGENLTAVLTQVAAATQEELEQKINAVKNALEAFDTVSGVNFTQDASVSSRYWALRSGIFPTVGGMRKQGTTCLIEDIAFHIEDLPEAVKDLSDLLDEFGYDDSCIYGHALDGNFHFIINQAFDSEAEVRRYENMIRAVAKMVVEKYRGSLKAEHGTGRNMAPFVKYEWGDAAFGAMRRLKEIFDPRGILNPGVIFNEDPDCFIKQLKALPVLEAFEGAPEETLEAYRKINKCIECGFCEVNCLSCGFSLSSRMRIAVQREMARLRGLGREKEADLLSRAYSEPGEKSCAADGLCSMSCPMGINVGDMTHELRRQGIGLVEKDMWIFAAEHFNWMSGSLRAVMRLAGLGRAILGDNTMSSLCRGLHKGLGVPLWTPSFPRPYKIPASLLKKARKKSSAVAAPASADSGEKTAVPHETAPLKVVYFPSCFNQMMGNAKGTPAPRPLVEETVDLLHKAGYEVVFPENKNKLCCGTIWESKGMPEIADKKVRELEQALLEASENGLYPVLCDQSPCLHRMRKCIKSLKLYEPAEFISKFVIGKVQIEQTSEPVAVHITCSMRLMGKGEVLVNLAKLCSDNVIVPEEVGCCGFAGDKGMTHPELNKWALRKLKPQIAAAKVKTGYSNSRTCEIGLQTNSGIPYISIVYLVNSHAKKI